MRARHEDDDHDRQQKDHHVGETVFPRSEHICHFLFVRRSPRSAGVVSDPARAVQDRTEKGHDQREDVEVAELGNIIRVHETLSRNVIPHDGRNIVGPREVQNDVADDDDEDRVAEQSLKAVCDQQRDAPARPDEDHCKTETERYNDDIAGQVDAENHDVMRQPEIIDEEVCRDRRADGVCHHFRNCAQNGAENTEELAPVAKFQKLADGEASRLPPAVDAVSGQCHEHPDRRRDRRPETDRETGLIILFRACHERDDGKSRRQITHRDHIPSRNTSGGKKVHHAARILPGINRHADQQHHRDDYDHPVQPRHFFLLPFIGPVTVIFL